MHVNISPLREVGRENQALATGLLVKDSSSPSSPTVWGLGVELSEET